MNTKNKNILLGVLIVGVLSMTVAFAALSTRLNINGTTNVAATKWNIHFQRWAKVSIPTVNGHNNTATSPEVSALTMSQQTNTTKVEGISVVLNQPGDTAKYTFQIINEGTIDAKLSAFTPTISGDSGNKISYTVVCKDSHSNNEPTGNTIDVNSVLTVNQTIYCSLEVTYKDVTNTQTAGQDQTYHQDAINASISAAWTWIQDDGVVAATWDNYKTPSQKSGGATLPDNSQYWIQQNTSTNYSELCVVFDNGTVCLTNSTTGRDDEFTDASNGNVTGYTLQKKTEMEQAGASCSVSIRNVKCNGTDFECYIRKSGTVQCYASSGGNNCYISSDGSTICE